MTRLLWMAAGWTAFGAGAVGAVLPLVPTVPFMLLAAFCFARGSDRVHAWLLAHPSFGPAILDWQEHGAISPPAKRWAVGAISAGLALSLAIKVAPWVLATQGVVLAGVLAFILTRPDGGPR